MKTLHVQLRPAFAMLAWLSAAAFIRMPAFAEEHEVSIPAPAQDWSYAASFLYMDRYYGTFVGGIFYDGPMSFTDLIASRKDSSGTTRFDLSIGQKLDHMSSYDTDGGNEYDFTVGRSLRKGPEEFPVDIDASVCYLAVHNLRMSRDDVLATTIRADLPAVPVVQPYLIVTRFDFLKHSPNGGCLYYGGLIRKQSLGIAYRGSELAAVLEYRTAYADKLLFGTDQGWIYHRLSVSIPFEAANTWTITPTVVFQDRAGGQRRGHDFVDRARTFYTLAISHGF